VLCSVRADCYTRGRPCRSSPRSRRAAQGRVRAPRPSGRLAVFSRRSRPGVRAGKRLVESWPPSIPGITAESSTRARQGEGGSPRNPAQPPPSRSWARTRTMASACTGLPSGLRVRHLVEAILDVSSGDSGLSDPTRAALRRSRSPFHIRSFPPRPDPIVPGGPPGLQVRDRSDTITADGIRSQLSGAGAEVPDFLRAPRPWWRDARVRGGRTGVELLKHVQRPPPTRPAPPLPAASLFDLGPTAAARR